MKVSAFRALLRTKPILGYATAVLLTLFGVALRLLIGDSLRGIPFITIFPAVVLTAYVASVRPALLSMVLGGFLAWYLWLNQSPQAISQWGPSGPSLLAYLIVSTIVAVLVASLVQANEQLIATQMAHEALLTELEVKVANRTAELDDINQQLRQEIAGRGEAEAQLAHAQRLDSLGQLVGGIAHDFNNILSVIIGNLDLAKRRIEKGDARIGSHLDASRDGAQKGADLTQRLLAFARRQPLEPTIFDLNEALLSLRQMTQQAVRGDIKVIYELIDQACLVRLDRGQFENAVLNLAINARDAMPSGGNLHIKSAQANVKQVDANECNSRDDYHRVMVSDDGRGIDPGIIGRVFDPFFTTKPVGEGTGLGLSQIHGYLAQSGGFVTIDSEPEIGTTVTLHIPAFFD